MKSIANKILLIFLLVVTLVMVILGFIIINIEITGIKKNMKETNILLTERLSETLLLPLWNLDSPQIERSIKFEFQDENVLAIFLYDEEDKATEHCFLRKDKEIKNIENTKEIIEKAFLHSKKEIKKDETKIGSIEVIFSDKVFNEAILSKTFGIIIQLIILLTAITIVSLILFKQILITP